MLAFARLVLRVLSNVLGFACKDRVERQREGLAEEVCLGHEIRGLFMNKDLEGFSNGRVACLIAAVDVSFLHLRRARVGPMQSFLHPILLSTKSLQQMIGHWLSVRSLINRLSGHDDVTDGLLLRLRGDDVNQLNPLAPLSIMKGGWSWDAQCLYLGLLVYMPLFWPQERSE